MTLKNDQELANTRAKLQMLEELYRDTSNDRLEDTHVRELSLHSLKELINQLKKSPATKRIMWFAAKVVMYRQASLCHIVFSTPAGVTGCSHGWSDAERRGTRGQCDSTGPPRRGRRQQ